MTIANATIDADVYYKLCQVMQLSLLQLQKIVSFIFVFIITATKCVHLLVFTNLTVHKPELLDLNDIYALVIAELIFTPKSKKMKHLDYITILVILFSLLLSNEIRID